MDPYSALRHANFRRYATGNILSIIGMQAQDVAVGWELYERTHSAMALGLVGLVEILPVLLLTFPAGHAADRFDRRRIVLFTQAIAVLCSLALAAISHAHGPVAAYYALLFVGATSRAIRNPAVSSLLPQLVPERDFSNAVTWNSSIFQIGSVAGPALGGLLIGVAKAAAPVYWVAAAFALWHFGFVWALRTVAAARKREEVNWRTLLAGLRFVLQTRIILASITLDMFAVLLGGAATLLPIYAKDILHVGPSGLGWLRAAPSVGAALMAVSVAHRPPMRRAGRTLILAVAGFGVVTVVFGLSRSFWLSMSMLFLLGAVDNISVIVRQSLVQLRTPDHLRGRVSAVNSLFVGASNQLGGFESGAVAQLFGPVASVVAGGVGSILVVAAVACLWPELRNLGTLRE
ncbi:MAG TPA: MFS transporter [Armatimonadota bacterium]|jgi:MFS family permease